MFVRRFFAELRRNTDASTDRRLPSLRSFIGTWSLRRWLRDRGVRRLETWAAWHSDAGVLDPEPIIQWSQVTGKGVLEGKVINSPTWPAAGSPSAEPVPISKATLPTPPGGAGESEPPLTGLSLPGP